jgi:hypothetical protein
MLLHNRYFLYFIFLIAFLDFLYLGYIEDIESVSIFILVGILTAFFNKNMIVVLSSSLIITNVLKYTGIEKALTEGLENESDGEGEGEDEDDETTKPSETTKPKKKKASTNIKEEFGQDEQVVYTSTEETAGEEKMVLAHEKLLEKMNKYKPLLDTLSGLTKNIAIMKQIGQDAKSISDDNTEEYEKETADVKPKAIKKKADKEE